MNKTCCGRVIDPKTDKYIGRQNGLKLYNCPLCGSTLGIRTVSFIVNLAVMRQKKKYLHSLKLENKGG